MQAERRCNAYVASLSAEWLLKQISASKDEKQPKVRYSKNRNDLYWGPSLGKRRCQSSAYFRPWIASEQFTQRILRSFVVIEHLINFI